MPNIFLHQYFLFPITIGEGRLSSDPSAYVSLADQLNFYRLIGDFKFIHIFYFHLVFVSIRSFIKKEKNSLQKVNFIIIFSVFIFLFNQLVTANQIYIFSLIPLIASILHLNLKKYKINKVYFILIVLLISFVNFVSFCAAYTIGEHTCYFIQGWVKSIDFDFQNQNQLILNFQNQNQLILILKVKIKIKKKN